MILQRPDFFFNLDSSKNSAPKMKHNPKVTFILKNKKAPVKTGAFLLKYLILNLQ